MGSFNVACSISNISIDVGDPVVFIPLEVSDFPEKIGSRNIYLIYSRCFYFPAAFPIKGFYDDYGGIEHIEMDEAMLFNLNWYNLNPSNPKEVNQLWDCREYDDIENITSGMFIHQEIYDLLINSHIDEFGKNSLSRKKLENDFVNGVKEYAKAKEIVKELESDLPDLKFKQKLAWHLSNNVRYIGLRFREYRTMKAMAQKCFETGSMMNSLIDLYLLEIGMYGVNTFYFPAMNGYQCGNHYMSRKLYNKATQIVREKIKRYNS